MKKMTTLLVASLLAVTVHGCASLRDLARTAFERPTLTFRSANVSALDLEGATVGFRFDLQNPNGFGLNLARVGWGIEVEGTRVATGDMPSGLAIPAKGMAPVEVPVRIRWKDVPGIVSLLTTGRDVIQYKLIGNAGVKTPIGIVDLPMVHEDRLSLPGLPRFSLDGLSIRSASLTDVAVDVKLRVKNPNAFPIPAGRLDYALSLSGNEVARAQDATLAKVVAGGATTMSIPVRVSYARAGQAAAALARGGDVRVGIAGTAELAGIPLPLDLQATVPARR
jgi:LEA14-like dessication related protein